MVEMLMKLQREGYFTIVEQKFFTTGHSFNDCDINFASVEKVLKKHTLILPDNINIVIAQAHTQNPFTFKWMQREDFFRLQSIDRILIEAKNASNNKIYVV